MTHSDPRNQVQSYLLRFHEGYLRSSCGRGGSQHMRIQKRQSLFELGRLAAYVWALSVVLLIILSAEKELMCPQTHGIHSAI